MIGHSEWPEPGFFQAAQARSQGGQNIHKLNFRQLIEQEAVSCEQMAYLVIRVVEDERNRVELKRRAQTVDQLLQQLGERPRSQQLELTFLGLLQDRIVPTDFVGQLRQPRLKR